MALKKEETWVGFGWVGGGTLIFAGTEGMEGGMISCDMKRKVHVDKMAVRIGPGLGGGTGICLLVGVHAPTYSALQKVRTMNGWDANLSVLGKVDAKQAKTVLGIARMAARAKLKNFLSVMTPDHVDSLFNYTKLIYEGAQGNDKVKAGVPDIASVSLPLGVGLEASLHYTIGSCEVTPWANIVKPFD